MRVTDPVERIVADALDRRGISYVCDGEGDTRALDFHLPDFRRRHLRNSSKRKWSLIDLIL